jgi:hypothetical protein
MALQKLLNEAYAKWNRQYAANRHFDLLPLLCSALVFAHRAFAVRDIFARPAADCSPEQFEAGKHRQEALCSNVSKSPLPSRR